MRLMSLLILFGVIAILAIGTTLKESDLEENIKRDIINWTETNMDLSNAYLDLGNISIEKDEEVINTGRVKKILYSFINFMIITAEEVIKIGIEYGYEHPMDYDTLFKLIKWISIIVVVIVLMKPAGYALVFAILGIVWIKDKIKERKEKKWMTN